MDFVIGAPGHAPGGFAFGGGAFVYTGATAVGVPDIAAGGPTYMLGAPAPNPTAGPLRVRLATGEGAVLRATILDVTGRTVRALEGGEPIPGGTLVWDGRDERGRDVPGGVYFLSLEGASGRETARVVVAR
jgi:hypothetical protein